MNGSEPTLRDISVTLNPDTPEWPGDTPFTCGWASLIGAGASVNVSSFTSSPHVGTHADAPLHVREGWSGSHELLLDAFYGPAIVVDVSSLTKEIEMEDLEKIQSLPFVERLLLKQTAITASEECEERARFIGKFQQITSPVAAKGIEDTALYVYNRLASLNEVGSDPTQFGLEPAAVHEWMAGRRKRSPACARCRDGGSLAMRPASRMTKTAATATTRPNTRKPATITIG